MFIITCIYSLGLHLQGKKWMGATYAAKRLPANSLFIKV